ncbi:MAG TPA: VOC family protein [Rubricoccaceae bacterium]|jgi:predicted enzyme related to lactoylglutathione lyase
MFNALPTVVYAVPDLDLARAWYAAIVGEPYFEEPYYVGFRVGPYELGLVPAETATGRGGTLAYWRVDNADEAFERLVGFGATPDEAPQNVGGDIRVATVVDPFGNVVGIIEYPGFEGSTTVPGLN